MNKRKKEKKKPRHLFLKFLLSLCLIGVVSRIIYNIVTPNINDTFRSIEAFNKIKLTAGSELIIQRKTIHALLGSYEEDYIIYKHEYVGYINMYDTLHSVSQPNITFVGKRIVSLYATNGEQDKLIDHDKETYTYLRTHRKLKETDYYIYNNRKGQINLVKNKGPREDKDGKNHYEKNGLNYIKEDEKRYFQDYESGEKVVEITLGKKGYNIYKILSDKAADYPTIYLIYLFDKVVIAEDD
ncbi:hypothetical protein GIX45_02595 [Erwinia sp. CPCC 100877]|nr:hypothetical protein [Erwinia sp. CPCC 100877]